MINLRLQSDSAISYTPRDDNVLILIRKSTNYIQIDDDGNDNGLFVQSFGH